MERSGPTPSAFRRASWPCGSGTGLVTGGAPTAANSSDGAEHPWDRQQVQQEPAAVAVLPARPPPEQLPRGMKETAAQVPLSLHPPGQPAAVVAGDGSLKKGGSMGAAIVSLNDRVAEQACCSKVWRYLARRRRYALSLPPLQWHWRIVQVMLRC